VIEFSVLARVPEPLLLATLLASLRDAIVAYSPEGSVVTWNPAAERTFGYAASEALGRPIAAFIPHAPPAEELRRGVPAKHTAATEGIHKDGSLIPGTVAFSDDVPGVGSMLDDDADDASFTRLATGASSDWDADRSNLALAAARLGDWRWDARTDVVTLSARAAEIFGIPARPGVTWTELRALLHPEDREKARLAVECAAEARDGYAIEFRLIDAGRERWVSASGRGRYDAGGEILGMYGVLQDVTIERARIERERQALLEAAEEANRAKVEFRAMLGRELLNPLASILTALQQMELRGDPSSERERTDIARELSRLARLVDDLLDV
jgi:PAS domain S-box-containing protein